MRISDWSSDVCSSDLFGEGRTSMVRTKLECQASSVTTRTPTRCSGCDPPNRSCTNTSSRVAMWWRKTSRERKSVVWGKSVSGRVDLGGRRIIKKTQNTELELIPSNSPTEQYII